jgi:hypothetical protein
MAADTPGRRRGSSIPGGRRGLGPRIQANFVANFAWGFAVVYGGLAFAIHREAFPPWPYWVALVAVYVVFYLSFYIGPLNTAFAWVFRKLYAISDLLSDSSQGEEPAETGPEPSGQTASMEEVPPSPAGFPLQDAFRVQVLSIAAIAFTGWFTVYSGGPFVSPYGQVLLALPLLSSTIAYDVRSITAVYAMTAGVAWVCHLLRIHDARHSLGEGWAIWTAISVLAESLLVVWLAAIRRNRRWSHPIHTDTFAGVVDISDEKVVQTMDDPQDEPPGGV